MGFTVKPYPDWSWSQSRDALFQECARKYYYHYYASHNGWLAEADEISRSAYRLKQLSNLYLLLGDAVHQMAENSLKAWRGGQAMPTPETLYQQLRRQLNQAFLDSRDKKAQWMGAPKKSAMLHEIYYGGSLPDKRVEQIKERMRICADRLMQTEAVKELMEADGMQIREIEELNTFESMGEKIYVKLDLLYERPDGSWVIVDWKTGREDERNEKQQLLYALFLNERYEVPFDLIDIRLEYLLSGEAKQLEFEEEDLEELRREIAVSVEGMKAMLADSALNKPLPMERYEGRPEKWKCASCNFAEICDAKA